MTLKQSIKKFALLNAVKHKGKANPGAIVGQLIQEDPKVKSKLKDIMPDIQNIVKEVNKLSLEEQQAQLKQLAPELLEKKQSERDVFAFLNLDPKKKVNTGFPPGPEKYPHLGHIKSLYVNRLLADKHKGKFILRFEDTQPKTVKKEFYDIMLENFKWLGIKWDELVYASDHMELYYKYAEKVIKDRNAYMCDCDVETVRTNRQKGKACKCRNKDPKQNMKEWKEFFKAKEGSAILRLKIDLKHKNSTMRDPTIFRIIDEPHPRTKTKYRVWPNYDFQNAIMDATNDIDMRIRSKEFEMRTELQRYVQKILGLKITGTYEYARFNIEGVENSGRVIREKVQHGELIGWDDPCLTTIVALRRRGFQVKALLDFALSTGFTKSESTLTWDDLIMHNKRLLDKEANRYFFIEDPVEITIEKAPQQNIQLKLHPEDPKKGYRKYKTKDKFIITKKDYEEIEENEIIRLMDCLNFTKTKNKFIFHSKDYKDFKGKGKKIIHFLPVQDDLIDTEILMPDKEVKEGKASPYIKKLKPDTVIQFERFGFCRLDQIEKKDNKFMFWFTH
ncbi:glutamate--tRNA ligase [Candidatus Woesearchaeota archaeon]|nr:glutamate--tRNA ligase [Candidatus Woesearchaeota archaeon]